MRPEELSVLVGALAAIAAGAIAYVWQKRKERILPSLPSRIETTGEVTAVARYFASAHDITNRITGAWNRARATRDNYTMLREFDEHGLGKHIQAYRKAASELQSELSDHRSLLADLGPTRKALDDTWAYSNHNHYRTEVYTTRGPKGKTQVRTRQVYSHTSHDFRFDPDRANIAEEHVRAVLAKHDEESLYDADTAHLEVIPDEDDAMRVWETVHEGRDERPTEQEVFDAIDAWNETAIAQNNIAHSIDNLRRLRRRSRSETFRAVRNSKSRYHFTTYGGPGDTHPGPEGYQATSSLLAPTRNAHDSLENLFQAMKTSNEHVSAIDGIWKDRTSLAEAKLGGLTRQMLDHGVELQSTLFPTGGLDYDQRRSRWIVAVVAIGTGLVSGLISFAVQTM